MVILFETPLEVGLGVSCEVSTMGRGGAKPWTSKKKKTIINKNLDLSNGTILTSVKHFG